MTWKNNWFTTSLNTALLFGILSGCYRRESKVYFTSLPEQCDVITSEQKGSQAIWALQSDVSYPISLEVKKESESMYSVKVILAHPNRNQTIIFENYVSQDALIQDQSFLLEGESNLAIRLIKQSEVRTTGVLSCSKVDSESRQWRTSLKKVSYPTEIRFSATAVIKDFSGKRPKELSRITPTDPSFFRVSLEHQTPSDCLFSPDSNSSRNEEVHQLEEWIENREIEQLPKAQRDLLKFQQRKNKSNDFNDEK